MSSPGIPIKSAPWWSTLAIGAFSVASGIALILLGQGSLGTALVVSGVTFLGVHVGATAGGMSS